MFVFNMPRRLVHREIRDYTNETSDRFHSTLFHDGPNSLKRVHLSDHGDDAEPCERVQYASPHFFTVTELTHLTSDAFIIPPDKLRHELNAIAFNSVRCTKPETKDYVSPQRPFQSAAALPR